MKKIIKIAVPAALVMALGVGCHTNSATKVNNIDKNRSAAILGQAEKAQPAPQFNWSQIRQTLIEVQTAQAHTVQTTTFFFNMGVQKPVYSCPSVGFPVAATDQLTNPQQIGISSGGRHDGVISQIDPNEVYQGDTTGTYVLCVDNLGRTYAHYAEEFAHTVTGPAHWDDTQNQIVVTGAPTATFSTGR